MPRDREASFEPQLIQKHQTRIAGLDDKILALYARGMTTRDIQAQVQELYGVQVSPTFVSTITEAVMQEVRQWQNRPLDALYPIVSVDCLVIKVRENQPVLNTALYLVLGVDMEGPTNCATSQWKRLSLGEEKKAPQNREMDTEEGNKTEEKKVKSVEDQRKRGKVRPRRQTVLLGEISLPEERDPSSD